MEVYFTPWIGSQYHHTSPRILVIGDSHYCGSCERCGVRGNCLPEEMGSCLDFTKRVVQDYLSFREGTGKKENWMSKTFLPFDKIFYGKEEVTAKESVDLWNSITFYNFLQTAGSEEASNVHYSSNEYALSAPMAKKVIEELNPDFILVWGNRAYNSLPSNGWKEGTDYYNGAYKLADGHLAHCLRIYHPSRANVKTWHRFVSDFMAEHLQKRRI